MRKLLIILLGLFLLNLAFALEVSSELSTNVIVKEFNTPIEMKLSVTNASSGLYNVYTLADISITPFEIFEHEGGDFEKTFNIKGTEQLNTNGLYVFTYTLNHRGVEQINKKLTLNLLSIANVIDISTEVITLGDTEAKLVIKNKENIALNDITAEFSSVLFTKEETFSLAPKEELTLTIPLDTGKLEKTKAGTYVIDAKISTPKGNVKATGKLYLNEQREIRSAEETTGILVRTTTVTKTNVGNAVEDTEVTLTKNIVSRLFTTFNLEPTKVERQGTKIIYTWNGRLYPSDTFEVVAKTNNLFPFLIIIALVLAYFGITRLLQRKIEIKKKVSVVQTKGGDFALKIHLNLKTRKDVENVSLIDTIPGMVKLYNKFGTIKPTKIDAHQRKIQWSIGNLQAGEERVFNYIVYSKVGVMGKFSLPRAKAIFESNHKHQETTSNDVFFLSSQTDRG